MTDVEKRYRKALERGRKSETPWKHSGYLDTVVKGVSARIELDMRDVIKKSAGSTATLDGGTVWPKTWTVGFDPASSTSSTIFGTTSTTYGSGIYSGSAVGSGWSGATIYGTGSVSTSAGWSFTYDEVERLPKELEDIVREYILEQIAS